MKTKTVKNVIISTMILTSSFVYAVENKHSISIKTGSFSMATETQLGATFDSSSSSVFAIEYEQKFKKDMSWGVEFISYDNTYASGTGNSSSTHVFGNFKKYFDVSKNVQPYIGVGAGSSTVSLGGIGSGTGSGFGFQAVAGIKFPFEKVSALVEYKMISAKPDDDFGTSVDISGNGIFAGIGFNF